MDFLAKYKGTIATLLGLLIAIPANIYLLIFLFGLSVESIPNLKEEAEKYFTFLQIFGVFVGSINLIAIVWYILPSEIEIDGKIIKIKMKD